MEQGSRITVSEDKLRMLFAEFKLEILEEMKGMATAAALEMLDARVKVLELWQAGILGDNRGRTRTFDGWFKWATLAVTAVAAIGGLVWALHS